MVRYRRKDKQTDMTSTLDFFFFVQMTFHGHVKGHTIIYVDVIQIVQKPGNNMPTQQWTRHELYEQRNIKARSDVCNLDSSQIIIPISAKRPNFCYTVHNSARIIEDYYYY